MNKEVGYIGRGFLLLLLVLMGIGIVHFLISIKPGQQVAVADSPVSHSSIAPSSPYYNVRGQNLFNANCATCHKLYTDCDVLRLPYIEGRVTDRELLRGWIRNSDSILKTGNRYFNELYVRWNKTPMPAFPHLSDQDIDEILEYIWRHRK